MTKNTTVLAGLTAAAIAAGLFVAPMANAQQGGRGMPSFERLDTDGSGAITAAEIEALAAQRFAAMDSNGDGLVTLEELTARAQGRMSDRAAQMIERHDTNGDGSLTQAELTTGGRGGGAASMLMRADSNGDGQVTEAEFEAAMEQIKARGGDRPNRG